MILSRKSIRVPLPIAEAVRQARADLRLENLEVPEWSRPIFSQLEKGEITLAESKRKIDEHVQTLLKNR